MGFLPAMNEELQRIQARILVQRLGRLSADSIWAHRASGLRASLDKLLSRIEGGTCEGKQLEILLQQGFDILEKAAEVIPSPEDILERSHSQESLKSS